MGTIYAVQFKFTQMLINSFRPTMLPYADEFYKKIKNTRRSTSNSKIRSSHGIWM